MLNGSSASVTAPHPGLEREFGRALTKPPTGHVATPAQWALKGENHGRPTSHGVTVALLLGQLLAGELKVPRRTRCREETSDVQQHIDLLIRNLNDVFGENDPKQAARTLTDLH